MSSNASDTTILSPPHRTGIRTIAGILVGAVVGLLVAFQALSPSFVTGNGGKWVLPDNDYVAYLVAWNYYIADAWRFPLFDLPDMGYPEGGSVLFNDALPLGVLPSKILYQLTGRRINPFGWWILLTYVLQGAMAARMVIAVGVRSGWACIAAAVLAILNTAFMQRMGHVALSGHFLVLWAIALYFECVRQRRMKVVESTLLLAIALLVNSYLFAMVLVIKTVTAFSLWMHGVVERRHLVQTAGGMAGVVALAVVMGYGTFLMNPTSMKSDGFGVYSWNLVGLFVPPDGVFGFFAKAPRYGTSGQYEGEAWIGYGALFLLVLCTVVSPKRTVRAIRGHWPLVVTFAAFAVYAASNRVYVGERLLLTYNLPRTLLDLCNYFRASGRFIWPLGYSLAVLPVALMFRWWHPAAALVAVSAAVALQIHEIRPEIISHRHLTTQVYEDLIDSPRLTNWLTQHERLFQFPSWACGGLQFSKRSWGNLYANRELQVQLAASRVGVPTNSVYTSRMLKNCDAELSWRANPKLEEGVLYLLSREAVHASPSLSAVARSSACETLEWGIVCSLKWQRMDRRRNSGEQHSPGEAALTSTPVEKVR